MKFDYAHDFINQYGHTVKIFRYGIYANYSYFKAPIFIGTDFCILCVLVPLFFYTYLQYRKKADMISEIKLISVYAVAFYYAASIAFGITYNQIFLVYVILFTSSLFGMFSHIRSVNVRQGIAITKGLQIFLILSGIALIVAWMPDIISAMIKGETLPPGLIPPLRVNVQPRQFYMKIYNILHYSIRIFVKRSSFLDTRILF